MQKNNNDELKIFLIASQLAHKYNCDFEIDYRKKKINFFGSKQNKENLTTEMQKKYGEEIL